MGVRTMMIWCPDWPVVAVDNHAGVDGPVAVVERGKVLACSAAARAEGVRRGQRTRDAQSRCPELIALPYDPVLDARAFEPVVTAVEALVPGVQVIRPGMCALRSRGPARFYGGEEAAADTLLDRLATYDVPDGRIGIADGPFAAEQAARATSWEHRVRIIEPGESGRFLAPLCIDLLERPELTDLLRRLGLRTLGAFARLPAAEVLTRFGPDGAFVHRLAGGSDGRSVVARKPPPELTRGIDFEPPVDRVDQVAFSVKPVADRLVTDLAALGLVCTMVRVEVGTEAGRVHEREWLHPRWFDAADLIDRVRWQLQGSADHPGDDPRTPALRRKTATSELTAAVNRIRLVPEQVDPVGAHADGLWGGGPDEQVHRALSRVQSMLGHGAVGTLALNGGRGEADRQILVPWGDRPVPDRPPELPWPGSLPPPAPAIVFPTPRPAVVLAANGSPVMVSARGVLSGDPARFGPEDGELQPVIAWAGPWPVEERWWDADTARRLARFQIVGADGTAWLLAVQNGRWWTEASYDEERTMTSSRHLTVVRGPE